MRSEQCRSIALQAFVVEWLAGLRCTIAWCEVCAATVAAVQLSKKPMADKMIGYLTKYLTKDIAEGAAADGELTDRQRDHARRLNEQVRYLPCSPECANWLRYGVTPKDTRPGMTPGSCRKRAHQAERLAAAGAGCSCPVLDRQDPH